MRERSPFLKELMIGHSIMVSCLSNYLVRFFRELG
jgi:hypothetical protein